MFCIKSWEGGYNNSACIGVAKEHVVYYWNPTEKIFSHFATKCWFPKAELDQQINALSYHLLDMIKETINVL